MSDYCSTAETLQHKLERTKNPDARHKIRNQMNDHRRGCYTKYCRTQTSKIWRDLKN